MLTPRKIVRYREPVFSRIDTDRGTRSRKVARPPFRRVLMSWWKPSETLSVDPPDNVYNSRMIVSRPPFEERKEVMQKIARYSKGGSKAAALIRLHGYGDPVIQTKTRSKFYLRLVLQKLIHKL